MKSALITGITGQDGAYLTRLLLRKGYRVHGIKQRCEIDNTKNLAPLLQNENLHLHDGDLSDGGNITRLLYQTAPDEIYNLGAQSHVGTSFALPEHTANINGLGALRLLEALRSLKSPARFYQASSSELFGNAPPPQNEQTPFAPCSPYAVAKLFAYWSARNYRETYNLHVSNGILFNHESPLRGEDFVTRKVTKAVAEIHHGTRAEITLGNLNAKRDWGHAADYVEGMWRMLQQDTPGDYVLATGTERSVRDLVERAFACINIQIEWHGTQQAEVGKNAETGNILVQVDPKLYRPADVNHLCGDAKKARQKLGWAPKYTFEDMIEEMVKTDIAMLHSQGQQESDRRILNNAA